MTADQIIRAAIERRAPTHAIAPTESFRPPRGSHAGTVRLLDTVRFQRNAG